MKIPLITLVALTLSGSLMADETFEKNAKPSPFAQLMQEDSPFDTDRNGALSEEELSQAFESIIENRVQRNKERNRSEVVFSPIPEDIAAFLLRDFDFNGNRMIEPDELAASKGSLKKFRLGLNSRPSAGKA